MAAQLCQAHNLLCSHDSLRWYQVSSLRYHCQVRIAMRTLCWMQCISVGTCCPARLQVLSAAYMIWRAARSCPGGWLYLYSLPVLLAEVSMSLLANIFVLSMWSQLDRPARWLEDMMPANAFPAVDVYIVAYDGVSCRKDIMHDVLLCKLLVPAQTTMYNPTCLIAGDLLNMMNHTVCHSKGGAFRSVLQCPVRLSPVLSCLPQPLTCYCMMSTTAGPYSALLCMDHRACGCGAADLHCCPEPQLPWQPPGGARVG
jgi:hypothetical protein